jgi:hypothetical protein
MRRAHADLAGFAGGDLLSKPDDTDRRAAKRIAAMVSPWEPPDAD